MPVLLSSADISQPFPKVTPLLGIGLWPFLVLLPSLLVSVVSFLRSLEGKEETPVLWVPNGSSALDAAGRAGKSVQCNCLCK